MYILQKKIYILLGVQTFHVLKTVQKCKKKPKNSKILKNDGHFRIPHPQISLNSFQTFAKMWFIFYYVGGWNND